MSICPSANSFCNKSGGRATKGHQREINIILVSFVGGRLIQFISLFCKHSHCYCMASFFSITQGEISFADLVKRNEAVPTSAGQLGSLCRQPGTMKHTLQSISNQLSTQVSAVHTRHKVHVNWFWVLLLFSASTPKRVPYRFTEDKVLC